MPNNKTTKKKRSLIIESSSSTKSSRSSVERKRVLKTKKRGLIIEPSSTQEEKEKIELLNSGKLGANKIDLKISQDMKPSMTTITLPSGRLNEQFIELMEKLSDIMLKQGEPFRARAYQKAQETIMAYPDDILHPSALKGKPNIGPTIMEKLEEYVKTGTLKVLEREKTNPVNILAEVYGIGPKKAKDLVDNGITTIQQLRQNQEQLNDVQKVGLRFYEDVLKRIPRSEIEEYKAIFESDFQKVATPNSRFEIVGSYRRGAQSSGDIDMIITSDNPQIFVNFINLLIKLIKSQ
jgi:predicted flap endonuclease-1-like 5' DNA nuclease/predicted nucleotidyltransferase